jgi:hypothetical protein
MATFQDLAADNPNIRQQYDERREQRSQNGEIRPITRPSVDIRWPWVRRTRRTGDRRLCRR